MSTRLLRLFAITAAVVIVLGAAAVVVLVMTTPNLDVTDWRVLANAATGRGGPAAQDVTVRQRLRVPQGWGITLYATALPKARWLRATAAGDLLLSQPRLGRVTLLARDADGDGQPDARHVLLEGLDRPHGMEIADGWLYVAESGAIGRVGFDESSGRITGDYQRIRSDLPAGGNHWSRTVRMGPDGWLYVSVGSSCNVCEEEHPWRASLLRLRPDGSELQLHATGLRNSVGFDWAPWSGELYATDNGRDLLGDDFPPCELNRIVAGGFYGWPYANGDGIPDPDFGAANPARRAAAIAPAHGFRAHNAPLGIVFPRHPGNVARLGRSALVALHGSWNRSTPDGYAVALLQWDADGTIRESTFVDGFEAAGNIVGRPVDVVEAADGAFYVSDDYAGAIYRIARQDEGKAATLDLVRSEPERADPLAGIDAGTMAAARQKGMQLWQRFACAGCHAPEQPAGVLLDTLRQRYDVDSLADYFLAPTAPMPTFELDAGERRALAIWLLARAADGTSDRAPRSADPVEGAPQQHAGPLVQ
ncbi:MAG: hypothetical protein CALGDGBN_00966 [Pseudomonadales bacterium]|nr:hypothetical protein [Pseudomonadales bacterium]